MRNLFLFVLISAIFLFSLTALQEAPQGEGEDPVEQAREILDELAERYRSYGVIEADFHYVIESREEDEDAFRDEHTGTITLKGDMFRLDLGEQEIITNNETIWTHIKDAREVQVNNFDPEQFEFHPSEIFHVYEEDYRHIFVGRDVQDGVVYNVVELTPEERGEMIVKVRLYINQNTGHIERSVVFERGGLKYSYEILNMNTDKEAGDDYFTFSEADNPDVTVVDLR